MTSGNGYIGKQIGNYRITGSLDSGAFGSVYKGVHLYLSNREVAIKMMHHTHLGEEHERESFLQEARFLEMLKHPISCQFTMSASMKALLTLSPS